MRTTILGTAIASLLAACTASDGLDVSRSEDALRTMSSEEIVGTIKYGQTLENIAYTETPTFRALKFDGVAGDEIVVDVGSSADAKAWLLAPSFLTQRTNDDAAPGVRDSRIVHKLTQSGPHYIAFREKNYEDTTFRVSLKKTNAPPSPSPSPPPSPVLVDDPFSPASCTGAWITRSELGILTIPDGTSYERGPSGTKASPVGAVKFIRFEDAFPGQLNAPMRVKGTYLRSSSYLRTTNWWYVEAAFDVLWDASGHAQVASPAGVFRWGTEGEGSAGSGASGHVDWSGIDVKFTSHCLRIHGVAYDKDAGSRELVLMSRF